MSKLPIMKYNINKLSTFTDTDIGSNFSENIVQLKHIWRLHHLAGSQFRFKVTMNNTADLLNLYEFGLICAPINL